MSDTQWFAAPAKVNLALHVTGRRDDGYHLIETIAVFTDIGDRIAIGAAERDTFHIEGPEAAALAAEDPAKNLVIRARDLARDILRAEGLATPGVAITLEKRLPAGSGIGGGSADAAATLKGLAAHWGARDVMAAIGPETTRLGADVPMCLASVPLVASGIGETLRPLRDVPALALVLANPRRHVSTPAVFSELAKKDNPPLPSGEMEALKTARDWASWLAARTRNDLQEPAAALAPEIGDCLAALAATGPLLARMSGSGATCFGVYANMDAARHAATHLLRERPDWWITAALAGASGEKSS